MKTMNWGKYVLRISEQGSERLYYVGTFNTMKQLMAWLYHQFGPEYNIEDLVVTIEMPECHVGTSAFIQAQLEEITEGEAEGDDHGNRS